ncbi:MAG: ABC transporter permease [Thermocladium sp.]
MGLLRSLGFRAINLVLILIVVLFIISYALSGPASSVLENQVKIEARAVAQAVLKHNPNAASQAQQVYNTIVAQLEKAYGLNQPPIIRTFYIMWDMLSFNWGYSFFPQNYGVSNGKVVNIIASALPGTIILDTFGILLSAVIGIYIGTRSALRYGSISDRGVMYYAAISNGLPQWWVGIVFIIVFAVMLREVHSPIYFPFGGILDPQYFGTWLTNPVAVFANASAVINLLWHLALPLLTVLIVNIGGWAYFARTVVLNVAQEDFVTVARAKGLSENQVVNKYIIRPAAPAILTSILITIPFVLFGGFLVTEVVFKWWGLGYVYNIAITAAGTPDTPVVVALTYASTLLYIVIVFVLEILYIMLDPRVREQ